MGTSVRPPSDNSAAANAVISLENSSFAVIQSSLLRLDYETVVSLRSV